MPAPVTAFGFDFRGIQHIGAGQTTPIPYLVELYSGDTFIGETTIQAGLDYRPDDPLFLGLKTFRPFDTVLFVGTNPDGPSKTNGNPYTRENLLALDNIQFGIATSVPEPSSLAYATILLGIVSFGIVRMRLRTH